MKISKITEVIKQNEDAVWLIANSINFEKLLDEDASQLTDIERSEVANLRWHYFPELRISDAQLLTHYNAHGLYFLSEFLDKKDVDFIFYLVASFVIKRIDGFPFEVIELAGKVSIYEMLRGVALETSLDFARELKRSGVTDRKRAEAMADIFTKKKSNSEAAVVRVSDLVASSRKEVVSL